MMRLSPELMKFVESMNRIKAYDAIRLASANKGKSVAPDHNEPMIDDSVELQEGEELPDDDLMRLKYLMQLRQARASSGLPEKK